ncbi:hypothetical protein QR680_003049 [Steinernema hermaphroditum]|uniref:Uncharacterized protein n=1 Tax=Steinernema hermaphroditum TaxID=289476 RepID=A0AA39LJF3_9BILA|nr:hypothetical protein QR680_003049 [Steinernema hermaphroditum]
MKAKILVLGPSKVGKSAVANLVADHFDATTGEYYETRGVRIFEMESYNVEFNGEQISAEVELWDCSGNDKYAACWPAIRRNTMGIILICNPDAESSTQLLPWYNEFVTKCGLTNEKVRIFLHRTGEHSNDGSIADFRIPQEMGRIACVLIDIDRGMDQLKIDFNAFLLSLVTGEPTEFV